MPGRPDLRDNFMGRMRAALGWFSHLPPLARRSILIKGLIAAVVAFVIGMGAIYAVERGIGNSLSCGLWAKCPEGATPGIHLGGGDGTGAQSSLSLGRAKTTAAPAIEGQDPTLQQNQQNPSFQRGGTGGQQRVPSDNEPGRGIFGGEQPEEQPAEQPEEPNVPAQPETPNSASPAPGEQAPPGGAPAQNIDPSDASPAPSP